MDLLEISVSGAVLILAVSVARAATVSKLPKKTFLVLWGIVLLRLLTPLRISSEISVHSWMPHCIKSIGERIEHGRTQDETRDEMQIFQKDKGQLANALYGSYLSEKADDNESGPDGLAQWNQDNAGQDKSSETGSDKTEPGKNEWLPRTHILTVIWAAGCSVCLLFFVFLYIRCRMSFAVSAAVRNDFWHDFVKKHSKRLTQIRQSESIKAPLTYGLFHPVILMPANTDWDNKQQLKYVFMHECVHIRRHDTVIKVLLVTALAVHWFNPFVWMMYILYNRDMELYCDEMVIRTFGMSARSEYARILIRMEERKKQLTPLCNSFSKNAMEERIVAIMKMKERKTAAAAAAVVLACGVTGVFATSASDIKEYSTADSQADVQNHSKTMDGNHAAEQSMQNADYDAAEPAYREITNISLNLDNKQAEIICDAICKHMSDKYHGFYTFANYNIKFCSEAVHGDVLSLDIDVSADMTLIRSPRESPYAKGMREAIKEIKNEKKKKTARKIYSDYLKEVMPYYMQPETTGFSYLVQIPVSAFEEEPSDFTYRLFYRSDIDGGILGSFEEEADFTDLFSKEDGKAYIKEALN